MNGQVIKSLLAFKSINVENMVFQKKEDYSANSEDLQFLFKSTTSKRADREYRVEINTEIMNGESKDIYIKICMVGIFSIEAEQKLDEEIKRKMLETNTVAIMFPYVRSFVTTITSQTGMQPIILPPFNINALIEQQRNSGKNNKNQ